MQYMTIYNNYDNRSIRKECKQMQDQNGFVQIRRAFNVSICINLVSCCNFIVSITHMKACNRHHNNIDICNSIAK